MKCHIRLLLLILLISSNTYASDTGYEVEVIIFENTSGKYDNSESWSFNIENSMIKEIESANNKIENPDSLMNQINYQEIDSTDFKLLDKAQKINSHADYRVLLHKSWKQAGLSEENTLPIFIDSRNQLSPDPANTAAEQNIENGDPSSQNAYIQGNLKLVMSRYLHFMTDLTLIRPKPVKLSNMGEVTVESHYPEIRITSERRMRSRETHFIDHPLIGIIVHATPFKIEAVEDDAAE